MSFILLNNFKNQKGITQQVDNDYPKKKVRKKSLDAFMHANDSWLFFDPAVEAMHAWGRI